MLAINGADLAVRGTAWLAMASYFVGALLLLKTPGSTPRFRGLRWVWAAGSTTPSSPFGRLTPVAVLQSQRLFPTRQMGGPHDPWFPDFHGDQRRNHLCAAGRALAQHGGVERAGMVYQPST
jgi:hypothetical protein